LIDGVGKKENHEPIVVWGEERLCMSDQVIASYRRKRAILVEEALKEIEKCEEK
jgi:hypothetical protein